MLEGVDDLNHGHVAVELERAGLEGATGSGDPEIEVESVAIPDQPLGKQVVPHLAGKLAGVDVKHDRFAVRGDGRVDVVVPPVVSTGGAKAEDGDQHERDRKPLHSTWSFSSAAITCWNSSASTVSRAPSTSRSRSTWE